MVPYEPCRKMCGSFRVTSKLFSPLTTYSSLDVGRSKVTLTAEEGHEISSGLRWYSLGFKSKRAQRLKVVLYTVHTDVLE